MTADATARPVIDVASHWRGNLEAEDQRQMLRAVLYALNGMVEQGGPDEGQLEEMIACLTAHLEMTSPIVCDA